MTTLHFIGKDNNKDECWTARCWWKNIIESQTFFRIYFLSSTTPDVDVEERIVPIPIFANGALEKLLARIRND